MKASDYVVKSHIYGKSPKDVLVVSFNLGEAADSVVIEDVTMDALRKALGEKFIPQTEIQQVLEDLQDIGEVCYMESDLLSFCKENIIKAITAYDSSSEVNEFSYMGFPLWLGKETRAGLAGRFNAEEAMGKTDTKLWAGTTVFSLSIADVRNMLNAIEYYASQCFDCTAAHKASVEKLETIEDLVAYDYKSGYPEKLSL